MNMAKRKLSGEEEDRDGVLAILPAAPQQRRLHGELLGRDNGLSPARRSHLMWEGALRASYFWRCNREGGRRREVVRERWGKKMTGQASGRCSEPFFMLWILYKLKSSLEY
ncbi:hypothetical protein Cni_G09735 [Canna indica]|uniref:Uncharacterized protein n=1 Tax=Canna indica TaxID=4628 RepID=A0AAQ3K680_9LILI|nr:hypothetical protein Cni_G09735 [Canna indica]